MSPLLLFGLVFGGAAVVTTAAVVLADKGKTSGGDAGGKKTIPFVDPNTYFDSMAAQMAVVQKAKSDRDAENDARIASWKKTAKLIPLIGDYAGALIDLGAWLGKKLGSNYAEQNSPEDLQRAANDIATWLQNGFVPPKPLFTEKDGARYYADGLESGLSSIPAQPTIVQKALQTIGLMTIRNASDANMKAGVSDASQGNGSLRAAGWYGGKLRGAESIIAGIAASEYGLKYEDVLKHAISVYTDVALHGMYHLVEPLGDTKTTPGQYNAIASTFVKVMTDSSKLSTTQIILVAGGCSSCSRPPVDRGGLLG